MCNLATAVGKHREKATKIAHSLKSRGRREPDFSDPSRADLEFSWLGSSRPNPRARTRGSKILARWVQVNKLAFVKRNLQGYFLNSSYFLAENPLFHLFFYIFTTKAINILNKNYFCTFLARGSRFRVGFFWLGLG